MGFLDRLERFGRKVERMTGLERLRAEREQREKALRDALAISNAGWHRQRERADRLEREMRDWDAEVRRLLGPLTAYQRTTPQVAVDEHHPHHRVALPMRARDLRADTPIVPEGVFEHHAETIRMFRLRYDRHEMRMTRDIRFEAVDRKGVVAYSLSETMLNGPGFGERDVYWLAERIAKQMLTGEHGYYMARGERPPVEQRRSPATGHI